MAAGNRAGGVCSTNERFETVLKVSYADKTDAQGLSHGITHSVGFPGPSTILSAPPRRWQPEWGYKSKGKAEPSSQPRTKHAKEKPIIFNMRLYFSWQARRSKGSKPTFATAVRAVQKGAFLEHQRSLLTRSVNAYNVT